MSAAETNTLDLEAQTLMKQKEAKAILEKSINELTDKEKVLSDQVKLKETNLADLNTTIEKATKDLDNQAKTLKQQQEMVESVVKEKNESMDLAQKALTEREVEIAKKEETLESERQRLNSIQADTEKREKDLDIREFELQWKEKSVKLDIEIAVKKEKEAKDILADLEKTKKSIQSDTEKIRKENAKQKEIGENAEKQTQEFQAIYKKVNAEKQQNQEILSTILMAEERIKLATAQMRQEFERLIAKLWVDLPFTSFLWEETQEAVGRALLWNVYSDKKRFAEILKTVKWFENEFDDSEVEALKVKVTELETENTEIKATLSAQATELAESWSINDEDIQKITKENNQKIAELESTLEKTLAEFKKTILEKEQLETKLATIDGIAEAKKENVWETSETLDPTEDKTKPDSSEIK